MLFDVALAWLNIRCCLMLLLLASTLDVFVVALACLNIRCCLMLLLLASTLDVV
jgi:hypothetical protein